MKKKKRRRRNGRPFLAFLMVITLIGFTSVLINQQKTMNRNAREIASLKNKEAEADRKLAEMGSLSEEADQLSYIERIARERLGFVRPDDKVFIIRRSR